MEPEITNAPAIQKDLRTSADPKGFETETCSRCWGSGLYSYCEKWGHTCFKCGTIPGQPGSGKQYTKRGKMAKDFYTALLSKRTTELKPGDAIYNDMRSIVGGKKWRKVVEVYPQTAERTGGAVALNPETHEPIYSGYVIEVEGGTIHTDGDSLHRVSHTAEEKAPLFAEALAYQESLTKAGTPRKK
jgi:hypothetical protein